MTKQNLNIFLYEPRESRSVSFEKENNVTRAFLNTIYHSNNLLKEILEEINFEYSSIGKDTYYKFQVSKKDKSHCKRDKMVVLFIRSKYNDSEIEGNKSKNKFLCPDGLISGEKIAIIVESKVKASKDNSQIKEYNKMYFEGKGQEIELTWERIGELVHSVINKLLDKNNKSLDKKEFFLLSEFYNYLEMINLNSFNGIPFFNDNDEAYDDISAKNILRLLSKETEDFKGFKSSTKNRTGIWYPFYLEKFEKLQDNLHYTYYVGSDHFSIDITLLKPSKKNRDYILNNFEKFIELFENLYEDDLRDFALLFEDKHILENKNLEDKDNHKQNGTSKGHFEHYITLYQLLDKRNVKYREDYIKNIKLILEKIPFKMFKICFDMDYKDSLYKDKMKSLDSIKHIHKIVTKMKPIYEFFAKSYNNKK